MGNEKGLALIETIAGLAILGIAGVAMLCGLATGIRGTSVSEEHTIAESLVRSQIEYIESQAYVESATEYPVNPALVIPTGWSVPESEVTPVHETDDGLQKVTVSASHGGKTVLSIDIYKANRY